MKEHQEFMHSLNDLRQLQAMPLSIKVSMTQTRIRAFVDTFGVDGVYVSFSGGKDSTVLLDIVRKLYPEVPAVFSDTGLEYPEIRDFVKTFDNVTWVKPKMNFRKVIENYGYPMISKETSKALDSTRKYLYKYVIKPTIAKTDRQTDRQTDSRNCRYVWAVSDVLGIPRRKKRDSEEMKQLIKGIIPSKYKYRLPANVLQILGELPNTSQNAEEGDYSKRYDKSHWAFMLDAPFNVSSRCCDVMKKAPLAQYNKESGRHPITAQMADESALRQSQWLSHGCNIYEGKHIISNPMSFWTTQDVLQYIVENKLEIASVYGSIVRDNGDDNFDGQMDIAELGLAEERRPLKTTGCSRTGCMFCGYGCHLEKSPNRFERMKETHPKLYEYLFRDWDKGGLGYKTVIDWINENSKWHIKY